jgi:hypothetical protein
MQTAFRYFFSEELERMAAAVEEVEMRVVKRGTADFACCLGETKRVPSMRGNFSKIGIAS